MARQNATARPAPQGKGKKTGLPAPIVSKRAARVRAGVRHLDTVVRVGTAITFAPTGERLRVTKIEAGKITFEKLP